MTLFVLGLGVGLAFGQTRLLPAPSRPLAPIAGLALQEPFRPSLAVSVNLTLPRAVPAGPRAAPVAVRPVPAPSAAARELPKVESGDILFLDFGRGPYYDAIADPTLEQFGGEGVRLHHSGVVEVEDGVPFVWEAWPGRGVSRVPLRFFLARVAGGRGQPGGYYLGRLRPEWRALGRAAAAKAKSLAGRPYDGDMAWDGPGFYCSRLISVLFEEAGIFKPRPMSFGREGTPARAFWEAYFAARGLPVPDGRPGVSPLGIYLEGRERLFELAGP
ncbi:MAG: hypothetical protein HYZ75_19855 [Elusimicrobia bacterium]|nr:hypothetical protein [Elusimicrobiota bacterium]